MKYKREIIITFIITLLILFLKWINVLQVSNHLGQPLALVSLIIGGSFLAIMVQKQIDKHYQENTINYKNIDILKYICAILIIILHLRPFLNFSNQLDMTFNNIITRVCVPMFFIITGYFIAKKEKDDPQYIKTYIKKTIPLYLVWSALYLPVVFIAMQDKLFLAHSYIMTIPLPLYVIIPVAIVLVPIIIFIGLVYAGIYYHLWYFPAVLLSLLVLYKWKRKFKLEYLLIISFCLLLFGATETYFGVLPLNLQQLLSFYYKIFFTTRNFLFFGLFYVVLGYQIGLKQKIYSKYCFGKLIISIFLLIFEAILLYGTKRINSNILLSCVPLTYYLFIVTIYLTKNRNKHKFPFRDLSKYYYFIHPAVMVLCFTILRIINPYTNPYLQIIIILVFTHIFSVFLIYLKKKYPKLEI